MYRFVKVFWPLLAIVLCLTLVEQARAATPADLVLKNGVIFTLSATRSVAEAIAIRRGRIVYITRRDPDNPDDTAFIPDEIVDLPTVLAGYTINAAYINFLDKQTGSLEIGKAADLIVLEQNLFDIPAMEIGKVKVLLTMLEGKEVYRSPLFPALARHIIEDGAAR